MKFPPVGAGLFHACRWTDRNDEYNYIKNQLDATITIFYNYSN